MFIGCLHDNNNNNNNESITIKSDVSSNAVGSMHSNFIPRRPRAIRYPDRIDKISQTLILCSNKSATKWVLTGLKSPLTLGLIKVF